MKYFIKNLIIVLMLTNSAYAQSLHGTIKEFNNNKKLVPLPGASVRWAGTTYGTTTDTSGTFDLKKLKTGDDKLIVSFIGYKTDTINIKADQTEIKIVLTTNTELKELVITGDLSGSYFSKIKPLNTTVITSAGLQKAACCNLSESFQNSATVDINYSDAVTGAKQIQMLGLSGIYSQILIENLPVMRGLANTYGLGYVPGPWMNAIQVSKGTSSVINGYESITGQINIEYKDPKENKEILYFNLFGNEEGRMELNMNAKAKINKNLSTIFFVHGENHENLVDMNMDGFLDVPHIRQGNFMNNWTYEAPGKFESRTSLLVLDENRLSGQINSSWSQDYGDTLNYGISVNTRRYQFNTKNGFLFAKEGRSIGTMVSGTYHQQNSYYGLNKYDGNEKNLYINLLYADNIGKPDHKITSGVSYMLNDVSEFLNDTTFIKKESVPGVFTQYTYSFQEIFTGIAGIRADYNSLYGYFITPRFHFRYNINEFNTIRGSAGKGYRIANVLSENSSVLASSKKLLFDESLLPEQAWNYGLSYMRTMKILKHDATFTLDFFRTEFINQIIVDMDQDPSEIHFYNLRGKSYSNSAQAELTLQPIKRFDIITAFRFNDVRTTINKLFQEKPFTSRYKALLALSYATNFKKWQFDFTIHFNGSSRLPYTGSNPTEYQRPSKSPAYTVLYAQITKRYKNWDFYIGGENLTNFTQKDPIIAANDPFGSHFDTSIIWGPITGRMLYAGIRYTLKGV